MATQPRFYNDGNWVAGFNYGADKVTYPFLNYPTSDTNTKMFESSRAFLPSNYVPSAPLATYAGVPNTYLVLESDMVIDQIARARNVRTYSMIPPVQTSYPGSRYFQLPAVANDFGGLSSLTVEDYALNLAVGSGSFLLASSAIYTAYNNTMYGPTKAQTARLIGVASGGTFTLTYGANTTGALNWNDSNATIAAAINGLASVIAASLTATVINFLSSATGGTLQINWSGAVTSSLITMNAGSLTVTTSNHPTTLLISTLVQVIFLPDHYTIASHGFSSVALATVSNENNISVYSTSYWGSINANTIWIANTPSPNNLLYFGPLFSTYVVGGTYLMRCRVIETYYLPGVSPGITTPSDILAPLGLQNGPAFITAFMTLTGFQTYQSEGPQSWLGTRIYFVREIQLNFDDI